MILFMPFLESQAIANATNVLENAIASSDILNVNNLRNAIASATAIGINVHTAQKALKRRFH